MHSQHQNTRRNARISSIPPRVLMLRMQQKVYAISERCGQIRNQNRDRERYRSKLKVNMSQNANIKMLSNHQNHQNQNETESVEKPLHYIYFPAFKEIKRNIQKRVKIVNLRVTYFLSDPFLYSRYNLSRFCKSYMIFIQQWYLIFKLD